MHAPLGLRSFEFLQRLAEPEDFSLQTEIALITGGGGHVLSPLSESAGYEGDSAASSEEIGSKDHSSSDT